MFELGFTSHSRVFHSYWDVIITDEGLQILTYARFLWSLRFLKRATRTVTRDIHLYNGHLWEFMSLTSEYVAERFAVELPLSVFTTLVCCSWGFNTQRPHARRTLSPTAPPLRPKNVELHKNNNELYSGMSCKRSVTRWYSHRNVF